MSNHIKDQLVILLIGLGVYFLLWLAAGLKFGLLEVPY